MNSELIKLEVKNINFAYDDRKILDDISISLQSGHFYAIVGPNGSGKTTFLDCLIGHHKPGTGNIYLQGHHLKSHSKKNLAKMIALVPQNFYINFPFTAMEVVMMGRYPYIPRFGIPSQTDMEVVKNVMIKTDTIRFQNQFIHELSGGERQRIILARALAQSTSILILDEATSNLDIHHALNILKLVQQKVSTENKMAIGVFQDINQAAIFCDYFLFMKAGSKAMFPR